MRIGFVGLGQMGAAMAGRLLDAGHDVTVWNRDRAKAEPFAAKGAGIAASPAEAAGAGIVFTMLANDAAVEAVTLGDAGIVSAGADVLHIACSTVSVALTERLAAAHRAAGQRFVSAQVLGRPDVAAAGQLSIIAAGTDADLDACAPLFDVIGGKTLRMGAEPAMAAATKLAANFSIAAIIETVSEALRIAGAHGVEPARMVDFLTETNFGSRMIGVYGPMIAESRFEPAGFPITLGRKDVGLALDAAGGTDVPFAHLLAERMDRLIATDGGVRDWSALGQPAKA
jgi:3-hydroxyisobutyrate dehydrogenase-like beta-hydroxyacid dehydrogenase